MTPEEYIALGLPRKPDTLDMAAGGSIETLALGFALSLSARIDCPIDVQRTCEEVAELLRGERERCVKVLEDLGHYELAQRLEG